MERLKLDIHESLNNLISKDGNYIDLLTCEEYTLWYLLRHLGIQCYLPVYKTNCFLTKKSFHDLDELENLQRENFYRILFNIEWFFNIKPIEYCALKSTLNHFIKEGNGKNQLIYMRYDSFYDSLRGETSNHQFHAYPLAGYDDFKGIYYSIFDGYHEVKYHDLEKMYIESSKFFKRRCFYFETDNIIFNISSQMTQFLSLIYNDLEFVAKAWEREIAVFKDYQNQLNQIYLMDDVKKKMYVLKQCLIFHGLMEGIHGNFIFRLNLINQLFLIDTNILKELFLSNRKKFTMIANMFRKASIIIKDDFQEFDKIMVRIKDNIFDFFVVQSSELLEMYLDILITIKKDRRE